MSDEYQLAVVPKRRKRIISEKFAPCMKVMMPDRSFVMVPVDKMASDAKRSILVAKARDFVTDQLERLKNAALTPAEVKDLVRAVTDIDSLQREQYVTHANNSPGTASSSELGRQMQGIVHAAAAGAAAGTADSFAQKAKLMDAAARKIETVIDVKLEHKK